MHARNAILGLLTCAGLCACTSRGTAPTAVLRTEDFIADPATLPTASPPSPAEPTDRIVAPAAPPRPVFTVEQAREGVKDISIRTGAPAPAPVGPRPVLTEATSLVDAKIGEINGHPIRVSDMFAPELGARRLETIATTRRMTETDWREAGLMPADKNFDTAVEKRAWRALAKNIFTKNLNDLLRDEVVTAEARAELKPEEKQGLRYLIREAGENKRRASGGSRAELDRQLRAKNQSEGRFAKDLESIYLIQVQIQDKFRSRLKTSWKDVRLYYERHPEIYHPPLQARFRKIDVAADNAEAIAAIRDALGRGAPFTEVAALRANEYNAAGQGLFPDTPFTGEYSQGEFFAASEARLNEAARGLKPGACTPEPVERAGPGGRKTLTWLYLESIIDNSRRLSEPSVQMEIAEKLENDAVNAAVTQYISRLIARASFTDIESMANVLVEIACERYWPEES